MLENFTLRSVAEGYGITALPIEIVFDRDAKCSELTKKVKKFPSIVFAFESIDAVLLKEKGDIVGENEL